MPHHEWTKKDLNRLVSLLRDGKTYREAATELGRSFHAVHLAVAYHRLAGNSQYQSRSVDREARVLAILTAGPTTAHHVCRLTGFNNVTVHHIFRRNIKAGVVVKVRYGVYALNKGSWS